MSLAEAHSVKGVEKTTEHTSRLDPVQATCLKFTSHMAYGDSVGGNTLSPASKACIQSFSHLKNVDRPFVEISGGPMKACMADSL